MCAFWFSKQSFEGTTNGWVLQLDFEDVQPFMVFEDVQNIRQVSPSDRSLSITLLI